METYRFRLLYSEYEYFNVSSYWWLLCLISQLRTRMRRVLQTPLSIYLIVSSPHNRENESMKEVKGNLNGIFCPCHCFTRLVLVLLRNQLNHLYFPKLFLS
ncbi:hypothetical protein M758_1G223700 [Ceratodon purpureus]|nr:hypothetical protein M758_1G223700 [Ceratodon purpureus]